MSFPCPYCRHTINVKSPKPGRFKPKCPGCQRAFLLTIPANPAAEPVTQAIPEDTVVQPSATDPNATGDFAAPAPPADPEKTGDFDAPPAPKKNAPDPEKTGDFMQPNRPAKPRPEVDVEKTGAISSPNPRAPAAVATGVFHGSDDATGIAPPDTRVGPEDDDEFDEKMPSKIIVEDDGDAPAEVPETLGGYRVLKELGRGGMGAVYLAQQISLDRPVALKVMNPAWGSDPAFVARFTREAYAAAQLVHHNIVQIYDFGSDKKVHYFSMEFVDGQSLGDMIKKEGKVDVEQAVTYTLQAARGLKFAHDRGMIHRDIKPDNLMLNDYGVVKVADLGLVKTPGAAAENLTAEAKALVKDSKLAESAASNVTRVGVAMGTPAYMSPEQARDAASVDQRADVYSLGCTLYALVTGKPPFTGKTVMEIFSQHATAPIKIPEVVLKRMPKELIAVLQKMVAKKPDERFADMGAVSKALEEWLGEKSGGKSQALSDEQVAKLEECVKRFNDVKLVKLRTLAKLAIVGGSGVLAVLFLILGMWQMSFGMLFLAAETGLAYFAVAGFFAPGPVYSRARTLALAIVWKVVLYSLIALPLFLVILWVVSLLWVWVGVTLLAVLIAFGLHFGLDRLVDAQRQPVLDDAEQLFKQLRLRGMDEEALRNFVCKFGGVQWEEFYEALFGYEEKLKARDWWLRGQKGQARQKFAAWREPLLGWLDARLLARQEAREKIKLRKLEEQRLKAEGMSAADARAKAEQAADMLVQCAAEIRAEAKPGQAVAPKSIAARMLRDIEKQDAPAPRKANPLKAVRKLFEFVLGSAVRFVLGAVLIAGCLFWMYQNGLIDAAKNVQGIGDALRVVKAADARPLTLAVVPLPLTNLFRGYGAGLAGLFLLLSALLPNYKGIVLTLIAAVVTLLGPALGVPDIGPLSAGQLCMAVGGVLALLGIVLGRR